MPVKIVKKCRNEKSNYYEKEVKVSGGISGAIPFYCLQKDCNRYYPKCEMFYVSVEKENDGTKENNP